MLRIILRTFRAASCQLVWFIRDGGVYPWEKRLSGRFRNPMSIHPHFAWVSDFVSKIILVVILHSTTFGDIVIVCNTYVLMISFHTPHMLYKAYIFARKPAFFHPPLPQVLMMFVYSLGRFVACLNPATVGQWENNHHFFTKDPLLTFMIHCYCFGRTQCIVHEVMENNCENFHHK